MNTYRQYICTLLAMMAMMLPHSATAQDDPVNEDWREVYVYTVEKNLWEPLSAYLKKQPKTVAIEELPELEWQKKLESMITASSNLRVYSFSSEAQRRAFMAKVLDSDRKVKVNDLEERLGQVNDGGSDYFHWGKVSSTGLVVGLDRNMKPTPDREFRVPDGGCVLLIPESEAVCHLDFQLGTRLGSTERNLYIYLRTMDEALKEVETVAERKGFHKKKKSNLSGLDFKVFHHEFEIDSLLASADSRVAVVPMVYEISEELDAEQKFFQRMQPRALEGSRFHTNQLKRKGYNIGQNDALGQYVDRSHYMENGRRDTLVYEDTIHPIREGYHYPVMMRVQYRNHGGVYRNDTIQADDGRDLQPMYFVQPASGTEEMVAKRYEKVGKKIENKEASNYQLYFQVGADRLDPNDPKDARGFEEINRAADALNTIRIKNSLNSIEITGYASPDGDEAKNRDLARRRAEFFKQRLLMSNPNYNIKIGTPVVQPWTVVADTMEQMGYKAEAEQVRAIVNTIPGNITAQYQAIKQLPIYTTLINRRDTFNVLDRLRIDAVQADYVVLRVKSKAEIIRSYEQNPQAYIDGTGTLDYEYYALFEYFADQPKKLAPIAKTAYRRFNDGFQKGAKDRPWTLAAYYYALSIYNAGGVDTTILDDRYIRLDYGYEPAKCGLFDPMDRRASDVTLNPYNEPALVLLQIEMLMRAHNIRRAGELIENCYGPTRNPALTLYVKCLLDLSLCFQQSTIDALSVSPWNSMAIRAAQHPDHNPRAEQCWAQALNMIRGDSITYKPDNPHVQYITALLRYKLEQKMFHDDEDLPTRNFNKGLLDDNDNPIDWGAPMVEALRLAPALEKHLRWDGYFPPNYYPAYKRWQKEQEARKKKKQ